MNSKNINVGFVGAGYWGHKLLPKFLAAPQASLRIVCDVQAESRAEVRRRNPGVATTDSFDGLVADREIDAIVIVTPPATHFRLARKALESGKHVWIEKPLALRLDEGRELVQLARANGVVLFVDHTFLYDPAVTMIRDLIQKGELGDIYHLYLQRLNLGRIKRDSNVWWNSAPHDTSIVLHILGTLPRNINLHGYRYLQGNVEDLNLAVIEMTGGTSVFIYHNWLYPENTARLTVVGSDRFLIYEGKFEKRSITIYEYEVDSTSSNHAPLNQLPTTIPSKMLAEHKLDGFQNQEPLAAAVKDFLLSIQDGRAPLSNGEFSLQVLAVLEAGEQSLRAHGQRVPVQTDWPG